MPASSPSFLFRLKRFVNQRVLRPFYIDAGDWRQTVFLAGVGRSGTTWIQDLINRDRTWRIMFEPFYELKTPLLADWRPHQYLRPDNNEPRYVKPAEAILSGRIRSLWVDRFNTRRIVRRRLIKDIRAGLFLNWIKTRFPDIPIILAIRNPFAVVRSQLNAKWDVDLRHYLDQPELVADHLEPFVQEMEAATTPFERNFFRWCVENWVPLRQFRPGSLLVVAYEECCTVPESVNREVSRFIGRPFRPLPDDLVRRPSAATRPDSPIWHGGPLLSPARELFGDDEIKTGLRILRLFGLDAMYNESAQPQIPASELSAMFYAGTACPR
jgi:hypothetical protein